MHIPFNTFTAKQNKKGLVEFFFMLKLAVHGGRHESLLSLIFFDSVIEWKVNIIKFALYRIVHINTSLNYLTQ